jgi:hypothetical protein
MIYQLALIAVFAVSQVTCVDSNHPKAPEHNGRPDNPSPEQTNEHDAQNKIPVPFPLDFKVNGVISSEHPDDNNQGGKQNPMKGLTPVTEDYWWTIPDWWMVGVSFIQVVGNIAVIILLALTLRSTQKTATSAADSAKTARDSLLYNRAWVSTKNGKVQPMKIGEPIRGTIEFFNSGKTPAVHLRVRHSIICYVTPTDIERIALSYGDETNDESQDMRPLGPDVSCGSEVATPYVISQNMADGIKRGDVIVYVFGIVRYDDVCGTGVPHETRYCYIVNPANWRLQTFSKYNTMT